MNGAMCAGRLVTIEHDTPMLEIQDGTGCVGLKTLLASDRSNNSLLVLKCTLELPIYISLRWSNGCMT